MSNPKQSRRRPIVGKSRGLRDEEAEAIRDMILDAQGSSRNLVIPNDDLASEATTQMSPEVQRVIDESGVQVLLEYFYRNFLYSLGRFDEYSGGLILKWGDGYSRKHIWVTVDGENIQFETSHERSCGRPYCQSGLHVYTPELWHDVNVLNNELAEQFKRPVYERSDD